LSEFRRIRAANDTAIIKDNVGGTEELILSEIGVTDSGMIDLNLFSDLVDLYVYMPN